MASNSFQTFVHLNQTKHLGLSGTIVSDEELLAASGILQTAIDNIDGLNLGVGSGVFVQRIGDNLRFKSLVEGSGITFEVSANDITINNTLVDDFNILNTDFANASGNWVEDGGNLGTGSGIFFQKSGANLQFKTIIPGSSISFEVTNNDITINNDLEDDFLVLNTNFANASGVWVKNGENVGTGSGVFVQKDGDENLEFRSLVPGDGIGINLSATELELFVTPGS
jgi:hypothetical protein